MFKLNDTVTWKSQAAGSPKIKTGTIIRVLPAGDRPERHEIIGAGLDRSHESYLVAVPPKPGSKAKPTLYWPIVSGLSLVEV